MSDFNLRKYPVLIQNVFLDPSFKGGDVLVKAIDLGIADVDAAADLAFFKANPERMAGLKGKPIDQNEKGAKGLIAAWKMWHGLALHFLSERVMWDGRMFLPLGMSNEKIERLEGLINDYASDGSPKGFKATVSTLIKDEKKVLSYLLTLWPAVFKNKKMLWVMKDFLSDTNIEESKKGRFALRKGDKIVDELKSRFAAARKKREDEGNTKNWCLNFIVGTAMEAFSEDLEFQRKLTVVRYRYDEVKEHRDKKKELNVGTLSSYAAELQLENMLGQTLYSKWNRKRGKKLDYLPSPLDYINEITKKRQGWYFFLLGKSSHHTQLLGVRVTKSAKEFSIFQHSGITQKLSAGQIEAKYKDEEWFLHGGAGHRLWLIYRPL